MINFAIVKEPLNWLTFFFMVLIACLGVEMILDRKINGCGCGSNK